VGIVKAKAKVSALAWLVAVVVIWWLCRDDVDKATGSVTLGDDWEATFHPESGNWDPAYRKKADG
jgi:hypothetical protein